MKASLQPSSSSSSSSVDVWVSGSAPFPLKTSRGRISPVASSSSSPHLHHISSLGGRSPVSSTPSSYSSAVLSPSSSSSSSAFSSYTGLAGEIRCVLSSSSSSSSPSSSISAFYHPVFSPSSFDKIYSPCASSSSSSSASPHSSSFLPLTPSISSHSSLSSSPLVTFPLVHAGGRGVAPLAVSPSTQGREEEHKEKSLSTPVCAPLAVVKKNEEEEGKTEIQSTEGDTCLLRERTGKIVRASESKLEEQKEDKKMTGGTGGGGASNEDEDEDGRIVKKRRKSCLRHEGAESLEREHGGGSGVVPATNQWLSLVDGGERNKVHNENGREEGHEGEKGEGGREAAMEDAAQDSSGVCTPEDSSEYKTGLEKAADSENNGSGGGMRSSGCRRVKKSVVVEDDAGRKGRENEESRHHCCSSLDGGRMDPSSMIPGCLSDDISHVQRTVEEAPLSPVYLQSTAGSSARSGPGLSSTSTTLQSPEESSSFRGRSPSDFCPSECDSSNTNGSSLPLLSVSSSVAASSGVRTPEEPQPPGVPTSSSSFRELLSPHGLPSSAPSSQIDEAFNSFQSGDISAVSQSSDAGLELNSGDVSSSCSRNHPFRVRVAKSKRRDRRHSRQKSLGTSKAFGDNPSGALGGEGEGPGGSKRGVKGEGISRSPSVTKSLPACVVLGYGATMPDREISGVRTNEQPLRFLDVFLRLPFSLFLGLFFFI